MLCDDGSEDEKGRGGGSKGWGSGGGRRASGGLDGRATLKRVLDGVMEEVKGVDGAYMFIPVIGVHLPGRESNIALICLSRFGHASCS